MPPLSFVSNACLFLEYLTRTELRTDDLVTVIKQLFRDTQAETRIYRVTTTLTATDTDCRLT